MRPPPVTIADLPTWMREQERRITALEASHKFLTNLLALSSYGVRLPTNAERDERLRRPARRIPWPRPRGL